MREPATHRYQEYATAICLTLGLLPWAAIHQTVQILRRAILGGKHVFVVGAGGSQATANHVVLTLNKIADASDRPDTFISVLLDGNTSGANLSGADSSNAIEKYASTHADATINELARSIAPGDVVIAVVDTPTGICCHKALARAHASQATIIVWGYGRCDKLRDVADVAVIIPNERPDQVELTYEAVAFMVADGLHALEPG